MASRVSMLTFVGHRVAVSLDDGSIVEGVLRAYDKNGNVVLADAERTVRTRSGRERRSILLLAFLRGKCVVAVSCLPSLIGHGLAQADGAPTPQGTRVAFDASRMLAAGSVVAQP